MVVLVGFFTVETCVSAAEVEFENDGAVAMSIQPWRGVNMGVMSQKGKAPVLSCRVRERTDKGNSVMDGRRRELKL
jgi:hypothetical protein